MSARRSRSRTPSTTPISGAASTTRVSAASDERLRDGAPEPGGPRRSHRETQPRKVKVSAPTADRKATGVFSPGRAQIPQRTLRTDHWLKSPMLTDLGLRRVRHLRDGPGVPAEQLLRRGVPLPDAVLLAVHQHRMRARGERILAAVPAGLAGPPYAALSLPFLLLFRLTCYYYRGAYYRSVWQSPTACAVAEPHAKYTGETRLPAGHPEHAPVLLLHRRHHLGDQHLRRDHGVPLTVAASDSAWATSFSWST